MILLTSTSDLLRLTTSAAGSVDVQANYMDNNAGVITPGRVNLASIVTAATTTIVGSPGSGVQRNIKTVYIHNVSPTVTNVVSVTHTDGTNAKVVFNCTLLPDEHLTLNDDGEWLHTDVQGAPYSYTVPAAGNLGYTGVIAETIPRELCPEVNTTGPATGVLYLQAIFLTAGQVINSIDLWSATTAAGTPTNQLAGLYDLNRNLLATSSNLTTTAWAANSRQVFPLTAAFRVPSTGLYYIGFFTTATTVPTLKGGTGRTGGQLNALAPSTGGTSTTGLTTALPVTAAAPGTVTTSIYAAVR